MDLNWFCGALTSQKIVTTLLLYIYIYIVLILMPNKQLFPFFQKKFNPLKSTLPKYLQINTHYYSLT